MKIPRVFFLFPNLMNWVCTVVGLLVIAWGFQVDGWHRYFTIGAGVFDLIVAARGFRAIRKIERMMAPFRFYL